MSLRVCPEPLKSFLYSSLLLEGINLMAGAIFMERALRQEEIKDPITAGVEGWSLIDPWWPTDMPTL